MIKFQQTVSLLCASLFLSGTSALAQAAAPAVSVSPPTSAATRPSAATPTLTPVTTASTSITGPFALQGTVTRQAVPSASLTATIESQVKRKFAGPPSKFVAITLHLTNPTADSLILDGDNAVADYGNGARAKNATEKQAVDDAGKMLTNKQKVAIAVVTAATATLGGQLFYEWIQGGASNPKLALGEDEIRRRIEGIRLGARMMLPNETADGTVFLPAEDGMPTSILVPVLTYPARVSAGALRVDIAVASQAPQ